MSAEIIPISSSIGILNSELDLNSGLEKTEIKSAIKPVYDQKLVEQALAIVKAYQAGFENDAQPDFEDCGLFSGREMIYGVMKEAGVKEEFKEKTGVVRRFCFKKPS